MAQLLVQGEQLVVRLSTWEKIAAIRKGLRVPLSAVTSVTVEPYPYGALRGARSPGVSISGVLAYGTWRSPLPQRDFVALHGSAPAVRVQLNEQARYGAILATVDDPRAAERKVVEAAGLAADHPGDVAHAEPLGQGDVAPGDVAPGDVAPGDVAPGDVAPGDVAPGDVAPGDVAPGNGALGNVAPGERLAARDPAATGPAHDQPVSGGPPVFLTGPPRVEEPTPVAEPVPVVAPFGVPAPRSEAEPAALYGAELAAGPESTEAGEPGMTVPSPERPTPSGDEGNERTDG